MISADDIRDILRLHVSKAGSVTAWAKQTGVNRTYVNNVLAGRCAPGKQIANALGYNKKSYYIPCNPEKAGA